MMRCLAAHGLKMGLLLSLGLNMFLVGMIAGRPHLPPPPPHPGGPGAFFQEMAATLPPDDAARMHTALAAHPSLLRNRHEPHHALQSQIQTLLLAEPFEAQALARLFEETDRQEQIHHQEIAAVFVAVASQVSPAGRKAMAQFHPHHGPDGPPPPGTSPPQTSER